MIIVCAECGKQAAPHPAASNTALVTCQACGTSGDQAAADLEALLWLMGGRTLEQLAYSVEDEIEPRELEEFRSDDTEGITIAFSSGDGSGMGDTFSFPMTVNQFWERLRELEEDDDDRMENG